MSLNFKIKFSSLPTYPHDARSLQNTVEGFGFAQPLVEQNISGFQLNGLCLHFFFLNIKLLIELPFYRSLAQKAFFQTLNLRNGPFNIISLKRNPLFAYVLDLILFNLI